MALIQPFDAHLWTYIGTIRHKKSGWPVEVATHKSCVIPDFRLAARVYDGRHRSSRRRGSIPSSLYSLLYHDSWLDEYLLWFPAHLSLSSPFGIIPFLILSFQLFFPFQVRPFSFATVVHLTEEDVDQVARESTGAYSCLIAGNYVLRGTGAVHGRREPFLPVAQFIYWGRSCCVQDK